MDMYILPFLCLMLGAVITPEMNQGTLRVKVNHIESSKGRIHVGIYRDAATFPKKKLAFAGKEVAVTGTGTMDIDISGLAPGRYALAVFHDLNDNGKMDTNALGIPTEPYAFSNGAIAKWKSPGFEEAAFDLPETGKTVSVSLSYWKQL